MKAILLLFSQLIILAGGVSIASCPAKFQQQADQDDIQSNVIVFEGTVLKMAPNPQAQTGSLLVVYQLVKYQVNRVCKKTYSGAEIVVDHLILSTKELEGLEVGDRVCIAVEKSNRIFNRWNYPGIREESDVVDVYYIGGPVDPHADADCNCKQ